MAILVIWILHFCYIGMFPLYDLRHSGESVYSECRNDGHCLYVQTKTIKATILAGALTIYFLKKDKYGKKKA